MAYFVYVLQSKEDGYLYIGISGDPKKRLQEHNSGMTRSTKFRRPFELLYAEPCKDRKEDRLREKKLKSGSGREFIKNLLA